MKKIAHIFIIILFGACSLPEYQNASDKHPKLIVLISVDQMRGDYIPTFNHFLTRGLSDISNNGISFKNTFHNHATTTTAVGHATIATGFLPKNHGILGNNVYNRITQQSQYSVEDSTIQFIGIDSFKGTKASPKNLLKPAFGDIIKKYNKKSKSYSVSLKDRSAILMGGKQADRAFWFDSKTTQMVSTNYYKNPFPEWAKEFKANQIIKDNMEEGWQLTIPVEQLPEGTTKDDYAYEDGTFSSSFPHTISSFNKEKVTGNFEGEFVWNTPYGDKYLLEFSKKLLEEEQLGTDENCDVLSIGLSAADVIGHHFGPNSFEIADYYYKLDQYLADFMDFLNSKVGKNEYVIILTGDHGAAPLPEILEPKSTLRISGTEYRNDLKNIENLLVKEFNLPRPAFLKFGHAGIEPDYNLLKASNIEVDDFETILCDKLKKLPYIRQTFTNSELLKPSKGKDFFEQFANCYHPNLGYSIKFLPEKNYLVSMRKTGTTHGTPYLYDSWVPLIFYGVNNAKVVNTNQKTSTIDIAPTILGILDIQEDEMDGKDLFKGSDN